MGLIDFALRFVLTWLILWCFIKQEHETKKTLENIDKKLGVLINRLALQSMKEKE